MDKGPRKQKLVTTESRARIERKRNDEVELLNHMHKSAREIALFGSRLLVPIYLTTTVPVLANNN